MKTITCIKCQTVVAQISTGSLIKRGAVMLCAECAKPTDAGKQGDPVVEKLAKMFKMR